MKVNIQYQIDLKDLPDHVADLLDKVHESIKVNLPTLENLADRLRHEDPAQIIAELGLFREFLAEQDKRMDDLTCLIAQYQRTESEIFFAERERDEQLKNQVPMTKEFIEEQRQAMLKEMEQIQNAKNVGDLSRGREHIQELETSRNSD